MFLFQRKVPPYTKIQWFYFKGGRQFSISEGRELTWREKKRLLMVQESGGSRKGIETKQTEGKDSTWLEHACS